METLRNGNKTFALKTKWSELSPSEFVEAIALYNKLSAGEIDLLDFRLRLLQAITGYNRPTKWQQIKTRIFGKTPDVDNINSNLFILASFLTFPIVPIYNAEALEILSPDLQETLKTRFPFEIDDENQVAQLDMVQGILKVQFELNYNFTKNLIPHFVVDAVPFYGPLFNVDSSGVLHSDFVVEEFSDAEAYLRLWYSTKNENHLNAFVAMLYRPNRKKYNTTQNQQRAEALQAISHNEKMAVVMFFNYVKKYFVTHPFYAVLFGGSSEDTGKLSTGWEEVIQLLSTEGQGSQHEIGNWPLPRFFNAQINRLKRTIADLRQNNWDDGKISREMNIDLKFIEKL